MFGGNFIHQQIINLIIEKIEGLIAVVTDYPYENYNKTFRVSMIPIQILMKFFKI